MNFINFILLIKPPFIMKKIMTLSMFLLTYSLMAQMESPEKKVNYNALTVRNI